MARIISMKLAINEAIDQEMTRDPDVIMMGEDIVGGSAAMVKWTRGAAFWD